MIGAIIILMILAGIAGVGLWAMCLALEYFK